jgi:acyl carrier protein
MTRDQIRRVALEELSNIAPEADPASLAPDTPLREALDIDSMDFMNFVIALHGRLKVDIPEADYGRITTLADLIAYIEARLPI